MRVTEQALAERKNRLLHVAYDLFCEYGIDAVTVSQISKKSQISMNSIYSYFGSKATLVRHAQKILWEEILNHILFESRERLMSAKNGLEEIEILLSNFKNFYEHHGSYLLFSHDFNLFLVRNHITLSREFYIEIHRPVYDAFTAALQRGQADGSITTNETAEEQFYVAWGIMRSFVEHIVVYDKMCEGNNPWKEHFDLVIKYVLLGLKNEETLYEKH